MNEKTGISVTVYYRPRNPAGALDDVSNYEASETLVDTRGHDRPMHFQYFISTTWKPTSDMMHGFLRQALANDVIRLR